MNELLLLGTVIVYFSAVLIAEKCFGKTGLYVWVAIASLLMNVEVVKIITAFGIDMTLGNVLIVSTFFATDIISEKYGKRAAQKAALIGCFTTVVFLVASQCMLLFEPSTNDYTHSAFATIFTQIPRIFIASVVTYAVAQFLNVWLYDRIWKRTQKRFGQDRFLWIRHGVSSVISQLVNAYLFAFLGWFGWYGVDVCLQLGFSTFAVTFILTFLDMPFAYFSKRFIKERQE